MPSKTVSKAPRKSSKTGTPPKRNIDLNRRAEIGKEKRLRTRQQVLDAAFALLGRERGLTTRIEEICEAASISRGTFYNHFTSMEELFDALSYNLSHDFNDAVTAIISQMPDGAERVSAAVRYYLDRASKDPKWAWAMVHISVNGGAKTGHYGGVKVGH